MRIGLICSLTGVLAIWTATVAQGTELTFVMEGTVQYLTDPSALLPAVQLGQRVVYTYSFDSDSPDTNSTASYGVYNGNSASLRVGTIDIPSTIDPLRIEIIGATPYGVQSWYQVTSFLDSGGMKGIASFELFNGHSGVIAGKALLQSPVDLSLFSSPTFSVSLFGATIPPNIYPPQLSLAGRIDAFYAIPEPSCFLLFMSAALLLGRSQSRIRLP